MIIDTHVWLSEAHHFGDLVNMDDAMERAGWAEVGENAGLIQGTSAEEMIERLDQAGVDVAICHAMDAPHVWAHVPNDFVKDAVDRYPDRFIGLGSVNLLGGSTVLKEMEGIVDMGLIGMKMFPAPVFDMAINDERLMPIYEKAQELGMMLQIHTGWSGFGLLKQQHPLLLDEVAVRFPDLKIIVVHAGYNYYEEVVMMILKNPNMYAGTGWWGILQPLETHVRFLKYAKHFKVLDKCLWGTDDYDCREDVPFIKSFPRLAREQNIAPGLPELTDEDIDAYLGGNAARLLGLE